MIEENKEVSFFSNNLSLLLEKSGIGVTKLERLLGLGKNTTYNYLNGKEPKLINALKIANHFKVTLDDFIAKDMRSEDTLNKTETLAESNQSAEWEAKLLDKEKIIVAQTVTIEALQQTIAVQAITIEALQRTVAAKDDLIAAMKV